MATNPSTTFTDFVKQMQSTFAGGQALTPQLEQFWQAQQNILRESGDFAEHWFERRQVAARTALETANDLAANGRSDPSAGLRSMAEWQRHSMERLTEDVQEWMELCARCSGHLVSAEIKADQKMIEESAKRTSSANRSGQSTSA